MADSAKPTAPLSWSTPPAQTAVLFVIVTALCALNIYWHPSPAVRAFTVILAIATFGWAVIGMRMHLIADDEGVAVRFIGRQAWLPWSEVRDVEVVSGVRGAHTVRFTRHDGSHVDVPPSLLQPAKPTKKPEAIARLKAIAAQFEARRVAA